MHHVGDNHGWQDGPPAWLHYHHAQDFSFLFLDEDLEGETHLEHPNMQFSRVEARNQSVFPFLLLWLFLWLSESGLGLSPYSRTSGVHKEWLNIGSYPFSRSNFIAEALAMLWEGPRFCFIYSFISPFVPVQKGRSYMGRSCGGMFWIKNELLNTMYLW